MGRQILSNLEKKERERRKDWRRSSVDTLSPRSHWCSSFWRSSANTSARRFIVAATKLSASSTALRGSSTKATCTLSHRARMLVAHSEDNRGPCSSCICAGAAAAPAAVPGLGTDEADGAANEPSP